MINKFHIIVILFSLYQAYALSDGEGIYCPNKADVTKCVDQIRAMDTRGKSMFAFSLDDVHEWCKVVESLQKCLTDEVEQCVSPDAIKCANHNAHNCNSAYNCTFYVYQKCKSEPTCNNRKYSECAQNFTERCMRTSAKVQLHGPESNWFDDSFHDLQFIINQAKGFCYKNSLDSDFNKHRTCLQEKASIYRFAVCNVRTAAIPEGNYTLNKENCCQLHRSQKCAMDSYTDTCGTDAGKFVESYLMRATEERSKCVCAQYDCSSAGYFTISWILLLGTIVFKTYVV